MEYALALSNTLRATGDLRGVPRLARSMPEAGARLVRTPAGYAMFDERDRYVGRLPWPDGKPTLEPGGETVLLVRDG